MSYIIRLQNLPWSANALDIRQYFYGLSIPEGGVHIVGGELGDAFIAFSTDEDARQAFNKNNGKIKEVQITLMLSSRSEMQRVIEQARSQSYAAFMQPAQSVVPLPAIVPQTVDAKKDAKSDKRDGRRRSRSKSKERRSDRSRERRRHRRSRSRSRDRKSTRRRDRSRSRSRGRSRSKDRKSKDYRKRSEERTTFQRKSVPEVWTKTTTLDVASQPSKVLTNFPVVGINRSLDDLSTVVQVGSNNGTSTFSRHNRDSWPPNTHDTFIANRNNFISNQDSFQNRLFQRNNNNIAPKSNNIIDASLNCCIALEPFYGSYADVRRFFQGLFINNNGIKFINDNNGRSTGVVFVRFTNRKFKEDALRANGEHLNGITVNVSHLNDDKFEAAVDRYNPRKSEDAVNNFKSKNITKYFNNSLVADATDLDNFTFTCLTVDDLPTYCKEQDILHLFSQHPLVALILTSKKKGGHVAYVKFSGQEVARKAYEEKSLHIVGGKQVTVRPCKDEDFDDINKQHEVNMNSSKVGNGDDDDVGTDCLSVSKLPDKTTDKDIADFFSDIGVIPAKIHLISGDMGFTGQSYCEFASVEEASRAARKNGTCLGNTSVNVIPIKRKEMENILGTISRPKESEESKLPSQTATVVVEDEEEEFSQRPTLNNPPIRPYFNNMLKDHNRPAFMGRPFGGPRFGMGPRGPPRFGPPKDIFDDVPPGCTLYMKNVPYKANTNDILNFFEGYNHTSNVSRRYNANNKPSDEAKIIFFDPDEAARAIRELQKEKIWDRQIFLRQE